MLVGYHRLLAVLAHLLEEAAEALGFFRFTHWVIQAMGWRERQGMAGGEHGTDIEILRESFD